MLKKLIATVMTAAVMLTSTVGLFTVSAAQPDVYVKSATFYEKGPYIWLDFELNKEVKAARNFQNTDRIEEPSDFPDALVDAAQKYITWDGETLGDYMVALDSIYVLMCHFEVDKENKKPYLRILTIPNVISLDKDFVFEIKSGFITADYKKFNPFKATWDSKAKKVTLEQNGVDEPVASKPTTNTTSSKPQTNTSSKPPVSTASSQPQTNTSSEAVNTSSEEKVESRIDINTVEPDTEVMVPPLGSYDLTTKDEGIKIDVTSKKITLENKMTLKQLKDSIDAPDNYVLRVFENTTEVTDENANIRSGSTLRVENQGTTIGELIVEVTNTGSSNNLVLIIILIAVGVVLIAGGAVFFFVLNKKKA